ncbi:MAG TPA: hypothetical protein V6D11_14880 [Waterburya sp.]|jgi:hypothetical protein
MFLRKLRIRWRCNLHPICAPVSKRINVTLPDSIFAELEEWADSQGRPTANLAAYLIEIGIRQAKLEGEFKPSEKQSSVKGNGAAVPKKRTSSPGRSKEAK